MPLLAENLQAWLPPDQIKRRTPLRNIQRRNHSSSMKRLNRLKNSITLDGQMAVLWDRVSVHTVNRIGRFLQRYNKLGEIHLPTACPEMHSCEGLWDWSKMNDMGNVTPQCFEELIYRTRFSLTQLQHRDHPLVVLSPTRA